MKTVDEYIKLFPKNVATRLRAIRAVVRKSTSGIEEKISYRIPAYAWNGVLIYFAAFEHHIGLYAFPTSIVAFKKELTGYKTSKGTIQLPHDKPLPLPLIKKMMKFRVDENRKKAELKNKIK